MSAAQQASLFALLSVLVYAFAVVGIRGALSTGAKPIPVAVVTYLTIGLCALPFALTHFQLRLALSALIFLAAASLIDAAANGMTYLAFSRDTLHRTVPLLSLQPAFTTLAVFLLMPAQFKLAPALVAVALPLCLSAIGFRRAGSRAAVLFALAAMLVACVQPLNSRHLLGGPDPLMNVPTLLCLRAFGSAILLACLARFRLPERKLIPPIAGRGALYALSSALYLTAISRGNVPAVAAIGWAAPMFTLPLSSLLLREHPSRRDIAAAVISTVGVSALVLLQ